MITAITTILFTDIEGSTRLWEEYPQGMGKAIGEHDRLIHQLVDEVGGRVIKGLGDGIMATFDSPQTAVLAAVEIQRALDGVAQQEIGTLRVRMGIHTGEVEYRGNDIFGRTVNRAARLMATAHGGQIVLSGTTAPLIADGLPDEVTLRDLGEHRLKDLSHPDNVYQVLASGLSDTFPELRSLSKTGTNLPVQLDEFVGRESDIGQIVEMLEKHRLVTLTGPGGVGKTRTSTQVAAELSDQFVDGVWWVELAAGTADDVLRDIANVVAVTEQPGAGLLDTLCEQLAKRRILLVLDNFEHVLEMAPAVTGLLQAAPGLKVLVTSRVPLGVRGEATLRLDPLPSISEALDLFVSRASSVNPRLNWQEQELAAARQICLRVDGLPLAVELAAARCRQLTPQAIADRLKSRFSLLSSRDTDRLHHHRTIAAAVQWSYDLLDSLHQEVFSRLAVFAGGFELEAAEFVCGEEHRDQAIDLIMNLADQSLLQPLGEDPPRFRMLDTVKAFAREQSRISGQDAGIETSHTDWYAQLALASDEALRGADQHRWHRRLSLDMDEFRMVLRRLLAAGDASRALEVAGWLGRLWYQQGHIEEAIQWYERILREAPDEASEGRAMALHWLASMLDNRGDPDSRPLQLLEQAREDAEKVGAGMALAYVNNMGANIAWHNEEFDQAIAGYQAAVEKLDALGSDWATAPLNNLSYLYLEMGDTAAAQQTAQDLHQHAAHNQDAWGIENALFLMAVIALWENRLDDAEQLMEGRFEGFAALNTRVDMAAVCEKMADIRSERGDIAGTDQWCARGQEITSEAGLSANNGPFLARVRARLLAGETAAASSLLGQICDDRLDERQEYAESALLAAEVFSCSGEAARAAVMLASYDRYQIDLGIAITPLFETRRQRVLARLETPPDGSAAMVLEDVVQFIRGDVGRG